MSIAKDDQDQLINGQKLNNLIFRDYQTKHKDPSNTHTDRALTFSTLLVSEKQKMEAAAELRTNKAIKGCDLAQWVEPSLSNFD
jgi:hypothetical protein